MLFALFQVAVAWSKSLFSACASYVAPLPIVVNPHSEYVASRIWALAGIVGVIPCLPGEVNREGLVCHSASVPGSSAMSRRSLVWPA